MIDRSQPLLGVDVFVHTSHLNEAIKYTNISAKVGGGMSVFKYFFLTFLCWFDNVHNYEL